VKQKVVKRLILSVITLLASGAYFWFNSNKPSLSSREREKRMPTYFVSVDASITLTDLPSVMLELEELKIPTIIDLGFGGECSVPQQLSEQVKEKEFLETVNFYNFRGTCVKDNLFKIKEITIGKMTFENVLLNEELDELKEETSIVKEGHTPSEKLPGKIGWKLFRKFQMGLLLDFKNNKIAFCNDLERLTESGYPIESFFKVPLLTDRGLVEFESEWAGETVRVSLDTGSTWNVLNDQSIPLEMINEVAFNENMFSEVEHFMIGDHDLGKIKFHRLPVHLPIQLEYTLGMEFFLEHTVFIDFPGKTIYMR
jgi:predicted aspartyl protease